MSPPSTVATSANEPGSGTAAAICPYTAMQPGFARVDTFLRVAPSKNVRSRFNTARFGLHRRAGVNLLDTIVVTASALGPGVPHVSAHKVHQMLDSGARRLIRRNLHQDAVGDVGARIEKISKSDPVGALRVRMGAPQADLVHIADVVPERVDIVHGKGTDAPVIRICLELHKLAIDQPPEPHLAIGRDKELGRRIDISDAIVDEFDRLQIAELSG